MDDATIVDIDDGLEDSADQRGRVGLVIVPFSADAVKQLAARAEIETQVQIVRCLGASKSDRVAQGDRWGDVPQSSHAELRCSYAHLKPFSTRQSHYGPADKRELVCEQGI